MLSDCPTKLGGMLLATVDVREMLLTVFHSLGGLGCNRWVVPVAMVGGVRGGAGVRRMLGGSVHAWEVVRAVSGTTARRRFGLTGGQICGS
jgi:hypothetical protein